MKVLTPSDPAHLSAITFASQMACQERDSRID